MTNKPYRRRNYFIKKSFQTRFTLRFALLIALQAALIAFLFFYFAKGTLTTGYDGSQLRIEKTASFFYQSFALIVLAVGLAVGWVAMLVFIFYSHRIAGPLFRFQKSLQEVSAGDLTGRIHLRKKDQLRDMGDSINLMTGSLDRRIAQIKREIETASKQAASGKPEDLQRLRDCLERLKETAGYFKTSD